MKVSNEVLGALTKAQLDSHAQWSTRAEGRLFVVELGTAMIHIFAPKWHLGTVPVGADLGAHGFRGEKGGKYGASC